MFGDYHSHTTRCNHATGSMQEYVQAARARGLREFGFSEHSPWMVQSGRERSTMLWDDLPDYVAEVERLDAEYGEVHAFHVRLGMEMDFVPSRTAVARQVVGRYNWDYLIGSVHHLGLFCLPSKSWVNDYDRYPPEQIADLYFEQIGMMLREKFCDIVAHLDVIKKYGHVPKGGHLRWIEPLIPAMRSAGVVVEINTSGYDHVIAEPYPSWEIVEALHAGGVPLMVNSDAHAPNQVARHFEAALTKLRAIGVKELARFEKRKMTGWRIAD